MALSPASSHGSSSSSITRERLGGSATTVNNADQQPLSWGASNGPNALLDMTTPTEPTVIAAGVYSVTAFVNPQANLTAGGHYTLALDLDEAGEDPEVVASSPAADAAVPRPQVALSLTYYVPAGGQIQAFLRNIDGVAARDFTLFGFVQRLS